MIWAGMVQACQSRCHTGQPIDLVQSNCWYNLGVTAKPYPLLVLGILMLILVGCSSSTPQETSLPLDNPQSPAITPYLTQTPIRSLAPTATQAPTATLPPLPTPTPYLYTVVQGDTMIGIAIYFGISYDELSLANPDVNPNFLSVGTQLIIPLPETESEGDGTPEQSLAEVLPLQAGDVICYPVTSGGVWCYWPITNTQQSPAENIAGIVRLYDNQGEEIANQPAFSLLNLLAPGESIPLAAFFTPPVPKWSSAQGQLISAVEANQSETRYLSGEISDLSSVPINNERLGVEVNGRLVFDLPAREDGSLPALNYVWVLATAYDIDGNIVGIRRWEAPADQLAPQVNFSFQIFSLGKPIETVEVLSESRISQP